MGGQDNFATRTRVLRKIVFRQCQQRAQYQLSLNRTRDGNLPQGAAKLYPDQKLPRLVTECLLLKRGEPGHVVAALLGKE